MHFTYRTYIRSRPFRCALFAIFKKMITDIVRWYEVLLNSYKMFNGAILWNGSM